MHAAFPVERAEMIQQQVKKVTGTVSDVLGPVIGASVIEKGNTSNGTITDMDGNFSLNVAFNATLIVSYIGYKPVEVKRGKFSVEN